MTLASVAGVVSAWAGLSLVTILDSKVLLAEPPTSIQEARERGVVALKTLMSAFYKRESASNMEDLI